MWFLDALPLRTCEALNRLGGRSPGQGGLVRMVPVGCLHFEDKAGPTLVRTSWGICVACAENGLLVKQRRVPRLSRGVPKIRGDGPGLEIYIVCKMIENGLFKHNTVTWYSECQSFGSFNSTSGAHLFGQQRRFEFTYQ